MKTHAYDYRITWGDYDPAGIVFYPRFFSLFDEATAALPEGASRLPARS